MTCAEVLNTTISAISAVIYLVTAVFVIRYWKETQRMKNQMIEQIDLGKKQLRSSNMPVIDAIIEQVKPDPEMAKFPMQFCYDLVLVNKGSGPAFNVYVQRIPSSTHGQKEAVRAQPSTQIKHFQKTVNIIGKDERVCLHREHSESYRAFTLIVVFYDVFRERHESEFSGDRDGLSLNKYAVVQFEDSREKVV
jgi:hypothetical protein